MFAVETYAAVRRFLFVEGKSRREAVRVFGLSRETISKMCRYSAPRAMYAPRNRGPSSDRSFSERWLAAPPVEMKSLVRDIVERVTVAADRIEIRLGRARVAAALEAEGASQRPDLDPFSPRAAACGSTKRGN